MNTTQKFMCCFCGQTIEMEVTGLIVVSNWDKVVENQQEQQLFCHTDCLKGKMDKTVPLYIDPL